MKTKLLFFFWTTLAACGYAQNAKLEIKPLTKDFYIFTTYQRFGQTLFPSNGMYVVSNEGVIMIDAPWDTTQFQPLLDSIAARHHQKVVLAIATHSHEDRSAGLEFLKAQGAKTFTSCRTDSLSRARHEKRAEFVFSQDTSFRVGNHVFETYFAGEGHTSDNIVVWFGKEKILYGGCLIKSTEATNLGNLADANVKAWPQTISNLQKRYRKPKYIVTGHQDWRSTKSLEHTRRLLEQKSKSHAHQ
ncbi:BlaB/IND/MUS family subclass B1 metallo-beta-lactamase [Flexibacter flexilis]|nr:BlaB/IND/MUS family subclass B1 metallo-beta-lactamase [Flexibacter flexilis]